MWTCAYVCVCGGLKDHLGTPSRPTTIPNSTTRPDHTPRRFTILDDARVGPRDLANNFFVTHQHVGQPRAQVGGRLLSLSWIGLVGLIQGPTAYPYISIHTPPTNPNINSHTYTQVAATLLKELNPDVQGQALVQSPEAFLASSEAPLAPYNLVVATQCTGAKQCARVGSCFSVCISRHGPTDLSFINPIHAHITRGRPE